MFAERRSMGAVPGGRAWWSALALVMAIVVAVVVLTLVAGGSAGRGGSAPAGHAGSGSASPAAPARSAARTSASGQTAHQSPTSPPSLIAHPERQQPNIVFVLADDLSTDLVSYMPHVEAMERNGLMFKDYFVSDSLCCPSRASILTGDFPHDTGVYSNVGRHGGFDIFHARGEEQHTFAVALHRAGYLTAMMGKYLNGYLEGPGSDPTVPETYVPPGWSTWDVAGNGYPEFDYTLNDDGSLQHYGDQPSDYLTDVLARKGVGFIDHAAAVHRPFFLELATFAPHRPYTPAPAYAGAFAGITAPRPPSFDVLPVNAPRWLASHPPLTAAQVAAIDHDYQLRVESVQSVDDMIAAVQRALARNHLTRDTYIVFSSDNGLHMGEYRLTPGKLTAYDTDIRVPLVITGPGVPAGRRTTAMAENIDLAPTFAALGHARLPGADGVSLAPLLRGRKARRWANAILVEHRGPVRRPSDPDVQSAASGNPTSYEAMRTYGFLYVEYFDGEREYYDLRTDPYELDNLAPTLSTARLATLHRELLALEHCHGSAQCWAAMHVPRSSAARR